MVCSDSWLFSHITIVKRRKNLLFILYAWRKQISVLICFFLFQKLIFLSFNWSSMRNSVWRCTDANHFKQGQTIRMMVNEWHPHSVLNLRGKKRIQNLTHNCLLEMCCLKSRFFAKHRSAWVVYFWINDGKYDNTIPFTVFGDFGGFQKWKQRKAGSLLSDVWLNIQNPGC